MYTHLHQLGVQVGVGDIVRGGEEEEDEGCDVGDAGVSERHGGESGDKYGRLKVRMHAVTCGAVSLRAEDDHLSHCLDKELRNSSKLDGNGIGQREEGPVEEREAHSCGLEQGEASNSMLRARRTEHTKTILFV